MTSNSRPSDDDLPKVEDDKANSTLDIVGEEARPIDLEVNRRVLRKIDLFLMPAMVVGYGLVYYDKAILGSAALFGMTSDLHLSVVDASTNPPTVNTSRLSWATSIFYFGQLIGSYPMTYLLQRFNSRFIMGPVVMFWAVICAATAGVTTWQGLLVLRFFLGFTESIVPTAFMITFTVIGSALNYGFAQIDGGALKSWQYIYVLAGGLTFLFGLWCFALPNSVLNAWFLTEEERLVAIERLRAGHTGLKSNKIEFYQVKEAVLDVKVWLVALMMASAIRIPVLLLCCLPVIAGFAIIWKSEWGTRPVAPVVGYSIIGFFGPVVSLTVTLGAANVAGETKKSFMASAVFVAYCVGNIIGPQLVRSEEKAQHYPQLWTGLIIW
ncbi:hypothetical protein ACHAPA_008888 [Fusarium lateritium]